MTPDEKITGIRIPLRSNITDALKKMDASRRKLLIVMEEDRFIGLISIGDIQRSIIRNLPLTTPIGEIMRKSFTVASVNDSMEEIRQKMLDHRTECMPVLDKKNNLVDVYLWEDFFRAIKRKKPVPLGLPVVIMAGGQGTRLKPITNVLPKPLIPIGEKTILENIMDRFTDAGCHDFIISVNYKADMIEYYMNSLNHEEYRITYIRETMPLGTAGSLSMLRESIQSTFFLSNCDIVIDQDYHELFRFHANNRNEITIVAALKHYQIPYGTLETADNGLLTHLTEKPELTFKINSGLYILEPQLLNEIPQNTKYHITDLIQQVMDRKGKVGVFPVSEKSWIDIGNWNEYNRFIKV